VQNYVLSELDSGERVVSEHVGSVRSVSLGFWIGTGSRDETPAHAGVSHFIEHLLFKGTSRYTAQEIAEVFDGLGGELNAATSREHTVVYARVPDHHVETALDLMTDMVFAPSFDDLDNEREVVLEEIAMYEDTPQELVHDLFSEAVFDDHPLGRPVIGTREVLSSISRDEVARFHGVAYVGANIVVAGAGNLEHEQLLELLGRAQAGRAAAAGPTTPARNLLVQPPPPGLRFTRKETEQYHVCVGAPGIARSDRRRFAASILEDCFAIVAEQLADIAAGNVTESELERAKENIKGRLMLSMESTSNRMTRLGKSIVTDTELLTTERLIAEIDAVEAGAVSELCALLLEPERVSASGIGPSDERFRVAVARVNPGLEARAAA
jgi:predicted Zn-dependent peptidase